MVIKNKYISIPIYIGVIFFIIRGFLLDDAIIRSQVYTVQIDTVVVVDEGMKAKAQTAKFFLWHNGTKYKKYVAVDSIAEGFYHVGDSMVVSYIKDDIDTVKLHKGTPLIFILISILFLIISILLLISDIRSLLSSWE